MQAHGTWNLCKALLVVLVILPPDEDIRPRRGSERPGAIQPLGTGPTGHLVQAPAEVFGLGSQWGLHVGDHIFLIAFTLRFLI